MWGNQVNKIFLCPQDKKVKLIWSRASWVIHSYQLNMLPEIHKNVGFYTTFSRARLAGPVFVWLLCFFRKKCSFQRNEINIFIYLPASPTPTANNQKMEGKKKKKKNDWQIQWIVGPNTERFWKWMKGFIEPLWDTEIYKKWKAHVWRNCLIWINGIWRNEVGKKYIWQLA